MRLRGNARSACVGGLANLGFAYHNKRARTVPHPIDIHVGQRLRAARLIANLSQSTLGEAVDVSFQQIQKYEKGTNRISASRLYIIAHVLGVDISFFFEGIDGSD